MPLYQATARKVGYSSSFTLKYQADNDIAAVAELCDASNVESTSGLVEFEILEVLGKDRYRVAAEKYAKKSTWNPPEADEVRPDTENTYTPYTVQEAA